MVFKEISVTTCVMLLIKVIVKLTGVKEEVLVVTVVMVLLAVSLSGLALSMVVEVVVKIVDVSVNTVV